jgi:Effector-associated domain 2
VLEAAFVAWLVALLGDHAAGGLTRLLMGNPERRKFAAAMTAATRVMIAAVIEGAPPDGRDVLAAALTERFNEAPARILDGRTRVRTALIAAVQEQISPLADPTLTNSGRSFLAEIGMSADLLRDNLAGVAIRSIEQVGPEFSALTPLVTQLNADGIIELEETIATRIDEILGVIEQLKQQPPASATSVSRQSGFPVDTVDRIVDALLAIPSMYDTDVRNVVLNMLPRGIRDSIPRSSLPRVQVYNIVRTCPSHENGLRDLVRAIRSVEGDSLPMRELDNLILEIGDSSEGRPPGREVPGHAAPGHAAPGQAVPGHEAPGRQAGSGRI